MKAWLTLLPVSLEIYEHYRLKNYVYYTLNKIGKLIVTKLRKEIFNSPILSYLEAGKKGGRKSQNVPLPISIISSKVLDIDKKY